MFELDYMNEIGASDFVLPANLPDELHSTGMQDILDLLRDAQQDHAAIDDAVSSEPDAYSSVKKHSGPLFGAGDGEETEVDEIIVIGERDDDDPWGWQPGDPIPNPDGNGEPPGSGSGNEGTGTPPSDRPFSGCEDRRADILADEINNLIQQMPDIARTEYGALIWRDSLGVLHYSPITPGTNGEWNPPLTPAAGGFSSWSQVVGFIHSHPTQVLINGQWISVPPESHFEQPSSGDWLTADFYISQGASANNFTIYVSYDGQVREYDSRSNTNQSRNPQTHPAGHGNESSDYTPGATCGS